MGFAASLLLLGASAPDAAAIKTITGKLSKPGHTVVALAANGKAKSVVARRGGFRLRPTARRVTLHLRAPDGVYAGPVVIRGRGRHAILGVKAGARLGRIDVRSGYARLSRRLPRRWVDSTRRARARNGVPIGARVFGRVRSKPVRTKHGDLDRDGIPDPLDIDDDGDLILDNLDRPRAAQVSQVQEPFEFGISTQLGPLSLTQTVNANAVGLSTEEVDKVLRYAGSLTLQILPGDTAELDCGIDDPATSEPEGRPYCRPGGTGRVGLAGLDQTRGSPPFPGPPGQPGQPCPAGSFDCDGDGFGTMQPFQLVPGEPGGMFLSHGAKSDEIRTGNQVLQHIGIGVPESQCPDALNPACVSFTTTVQYVFATSLALVSYDDDGPGGKDPVTVSYPEPSPEPKPPPVFPVTAPEGQDVVVTLRFWRPQRRPISGELCPPPADRLCPPDGWIDIGGLRYMAGGGNCPPSAFSENDPNTPLVVEDDPNLTPNSSPNWPFFWFTDGADDGPANRANTFTYTLNLTQCFASRGFSPGDSQQITFEARPTNTSLNDATGQNVWFQRQ